MRLTHVTPRNQTFQPTAAGRPSGARNCLSRGSATAAREPAPHDESGTVTPASVVARVPSSPVSPRAPAGTRTAAPPDPAPRSASSSAERQHGSAASDGDAIEPDPLEEVLRPTPATSSQSAGSSGVTTRKRATSCGVELGPERVGVVGAAQDDEGPSGTRATIAHHLVVRAHLGQGLGGMGEGREALHGTQARPRRLRGAYSVRRRIRRDAVRRRKRATRGR